MKKAQLFLFYILIIVVLIVAALITVGIGNVAKTKSYTSNSADGGALAGASTLATAFNYVARANEFFEENYRNFHDEALRHFDNAWDYMARAQTETQTAHDIACSDPCRARDMIDPIVEIYLEDKFIDEMDIKIGNEPIPAGSWPDPSYGIIPHFQRFQEIFYQEVRIALQLDEDFQFDFYNVALAAAYKLNMLNSGIMIKLPPEGKEIFLEFIDEIQPGNVYNGLLLEFSWGEDRQHRVISEVLIDPIKAHQLRVTEDDFPVVLDNINLAIDNAETAISYLREAQELLDHACECKECEEDNEGCSDTCDEFSPPGCHECEDCCDVNDYCIPAQERLDTALRYEDDAEQASIDAWEGIQIECRSYISYLLADPVRYHEKIIGWVYDILAPDGGSTHPREVFSRNEQFHQGNAGQESSDLYELEDVSIESSAVATWNYEDKGYICYTDCDTCTPIWEHDAAIILIEE